MENKDYVGNFEQTGNDSLDFRSEFEKYFIHWKWFVFCAIVALSFAFLYLKYKVPQYSASTSIMIKDNKKSGISAELEAFKDLGIVGGASSNNPDNEIEILKSRKIIGRVVDSMNLQLSYYLSENVRETEVYRTSSPIFIHFEKKSKDFINKDTVFFLTLLDSNSFDLLNALENKVSTHSYDDVIMNDMGSFKVLKNQDGYTFPPLTRVKVVCNPQESLISSYRARVNISPVSKNSSVLNLSLQGPVKEKAEDVLDELVRQYNIDAINDKNQVSKKTKEFIDDRLEKVKSDLFLIDERVKKFKDDKDFTGLPAEAQLALESLKETNSRINMAKTQLSLAKWIEDLLRKQSDKQQVLPTSLGFENSSVSQAIVKYNELVLLKQKTLVSAGKKNPVLVQLNAELASLQSSLLKSLSNVSTSLDIQLKDLNAEADKVLSRVKSIPENERGFIDIARQQEIISSLYQYLLKKKEETDISLAVSVPNAKIIDVAYGANSPVSPKRKIIYLAALLLGLLLPFVVIYLRDLLDNKIHNRQELMDQLSIPYLGDVPKNNTKKSIVVGKKERTSVAESFRLIRTNLDFMLTNHTTKSKTIFVTSTTSGEGKSFVSINLAATLALSDKKVLLMGMDLRAPKITQYLNSEDRKGVTNHIAEEELDYKDLIWKLPELPNVDVLPSGDIPPNPAELLLSNKVAELFDSLKQEYDWIIVDTAPVNLVTDTLLMAKYADLFIYTVRANYLDKRMLNVPNGLYKEKRLPNMALVLNDTDPKRMYGYGYGYGGYGYGQEVKKSWFKRLFS